MNIGDENNDAQEVPEVFEELPADGSADLLAELAQNVQDVQEAPADAGEQPLLDPMDLVASDDSGLLAADGENADPQIAVNEMLSDAVLPDHALMDLLPAENLSLEGIPTFAVKVFVAGDLEREALKRIVTEQKLGTEEAWKAEQPLFTRLNEFQVIQFLQELQVAGIRAQAQTKWPLPMLSEEEEALGSLAGIPDPSVSVIEGAPSVQLPGSAREVLMLTTQSISGYQVQQVMGIVSAHKSIARRFFREQELQAQVEEEIQKYPGKKPQLPKNQLERLFRELFQDLQKNALGLGANAVVGLKIEAFPESSHLDSALEQMRLVAIGTAAVVEKSVL